jgi:hypothetical protein
VPSTPLFSPQNFFTQRAPSVVSAAVILYATGVVAVASAAPFVNQFVTVEFSMGLLIFSVLVGGALGTIGIWVVSTVLVYLLSLIAGGSGSVRRTAANIGWASLPLLFVNTITTAIIWVLHLIGVFSGLSPAQFPLWLLLFNTAVSILGYFWIGYLLTYAVHDARNLPIRRATLIAGLIVIIPIISLIINLL